MSEYSDDKEPQEESLSNVRMVMPLPCGHAPFLTVPSVSLQPDVVTKYKAASKIVNGELPPSAAIAATSAMPSRWPLTPSACCRRSGGRH